MKLGDCRHGSIVRIGTVTYRLYRLEEFHDGLLGTMKMFARLQPCTLQASGWWDNYNVRSVIRGWSEPCELVDDSDTAIAGDYFHRTKKGSSDARLRAGT
jgi:hypothetical protein